MPDVSRDTPNAAPPSPHQTPPTLGVGVHSLASLGRLAQIDRNIEPVVLQSPLKYDTNEVAELTGLSPEQIHSFARWLGRSPRSPEDVHYNDADVETIRYAIKLARQEGLDFDAMGSMIRGIASALDRLSMRQVHSIIQQSGQREDLSDTEARLIAAQVAPPWAAKVQPLIEHIWRRQFASAVRRLTTNAIAQRGLYGDDRDYPLLRAVGFADLVNFTARTENATAREFSRLIRDFTDRCWDIISDQGGRIVNFIGDAVFFVADNVEIGADVALGLAAPDALGPYCGPARVGLVWTRVIAAYGDVFGPGVNLAARISGAAEPNEVFIGPAVTAQLSRSPKYSIVPQPSFEARGIGTVWPNRLRYADDPRNQLDEPQVAPDALQSVEQDLPGNPETGSNADRAPITDDAHPAPVGFRTTGG